MSQQTSIFSFEEKGINLPVYIHKIDRSSHWVLEDDIEMGVENALNNIFNSHDYVYSLWLINSEQDLICVASTLNANRGSPKEEIPFIWINQDDLEKVGLSLQQIDEGKCLYAKKLHFNVTIEPEKARELCYLLMNNFEKSAKCKKTEMKKLVEVQTTYGCKAYDNHPLVCQCESI